MNSEKTKIGYKGFDKDLKCKGFQYEIGKTYNHDGEPGLCESGYHFCEYPLDVLAYYPPDGSRYAEVEAIDVSDKIDSDSKHVAKKITIRAEIDLKAMVDAAVKFVFDRVDWKNAEDNSGKEQGAASATGNQGAASATGYRGAASATGEEGCAVALGIKGKAKGIKGAWLTIAEWKMGEDKKWHRIAVKTIQVDGENIKADTFYTLNGGKFVEAAK